MPMTQCDLMCHIVKNHTVGDSDIIFNRSLGVGINMDDSIILHIGTIADCYRTEIRPDRDTRCDQTFMADFYIAD